MGIAPSGDAWTPGHSVVDGIHDAGLSVGPVWLALFTRYGPEDLALGHHVENGAVAQLVAAGLSNKQIGTRTFISERTVDSHGSQHPQQARVTLARAVEAE